MGTIDRESNPNRSTAYANVAVGLPQTSHFYKLWGIPESKGQEANLVWNENKEHYESVDTLIEIEMNTYLDPQSSFQANATRRYVLAPGTHYIPLDAPGNNTSIFFSLQGEGMTMPDDCSRIDGVTGSLKIQISTVD